MASSRVRPSGPQPTCTAVTFNGLDPEGVRWIRDLIKSLAARGRTVFVSSHLISEMALTAERLIVICRGRLLADTTVAELAATRHGSLEAAFFALTGDSAEYQGHGQATSCPASSWARSSWACSACWR